MPLQKKIVDIDGRWCHEAYVDEKDTWNGWQKPYFLFDDAKSVLEESVAYEYSDVAEYKYSIPDDAFYVFDAQCSYVDVDGHAYNLFEYRGERIDTEDGMLVAYPIGAGEWCWEVVARQ